MLKKFKAIAFEGGGMAGYSYMGALKTWIDSSYTLEQFTGFAGTSVGSIPAAFLALRANIDYVSDKLRTTDFNKFLDSSWYRIGNAYNLYEYYGYYKGEVLKKWLMECLSEITGNSNITFKQAYDKYGTYLFITKVDVLYPRCKLVIMSHNTHPDTPIADAIHTSCSMPYIYRAINGSINELGHLFVDGGAMLSYPIETLYSVYKPEEVMGLCLTHKKPPEEHTEYRPVRTHLEFVESIAKTWMEMALKRHISKDDWKRTCNIPVSMKTLDFDADEFKRKEAYEDGKNAMLKFISKYKYTMII